MDDRNYETANTIFETLNARKGFEVVMSNPRSGRLIIKHNDTSFFLEITPIYEEKHDNKPFETVFAENE